MTVFVQLELENFKGYKYKTCINWMQISSIIGPNGAGKSSLLDAIEFVFCFPQYSKMSAQCLKEIICNKESDNFENSSSRVRFLLNLNSENVLFQRSVFYDESVQKYSINDMDVSVKEYKKRLLACNINYKANNFLVHQNCIEDIALKNAKERCEIFERICNSISFKRDYDSLSKELRLTAFEVHELKKERTFYSKQKQKLLKATKETQKYQKLRQKLNKIELDYYFAKFYEIDQTIYEQLQLKSELQIKIKVTKKLMESSKIDKTSLKNKLIEQEIQLEKFNDDSTTIRTKFSNYSTDMLKFSQEISSCEDNILKVENNFRKAKEIHLAHKKIIDDLEHQYREVEEAKENYEKSQSQNCSLQLADEQYEEYLKLKAKAQQKFVKEINLLDSIERECTSLKDSIEDHERRKNLLIQEIEKEKLEINSTSLSLERIDKNIKETILDEKNFIDVINFLQIEMEDMVQMETNLILDIEKIERIIDENKLTKEENRKAERKREILEKLTINFQGVYNRLKNLCSVNNEVYQVAITKIMGSRMDNIVVDNTLTARKCIGFLKEQYKGNKFSAVETFLPVDNIEAKPYEEVLRKIQNERNAILALDIMVVPSDDIKRILQNVLKNVIICETDFEASDLCYRKKIDCVSLNGTYYKKDGTFSGGLASLLQKSKQWNYDEIENLKTERLQKISKLRELQVEYNTKKENKYILEIKLAGLQERLKTYLKPLLEKQQHLLDIKEKELKKKVEMLNNLKNDSRIKELLRILDDKNSQLEKLEEKRNEIEDEVFANFCKSLRLNNIRQYEQGDFKRYKERYDRKKEYDYHLDKIKNEIECEKSRDTKTIIKQLKVRLNELREKHENLKKKKNKLKKMIDQNTLNNIAKEENEIKKKIEQSKKELKLEERKYELMKKDLKLLNSTLTTVEIKIHKLEVEKHQLFVDCKENNIEIPLHIGTIEEVILRISISKSETSQSSSEQSDENSELKEKNVKIDYTKLSDSMKNLDSVELSNQIQILKDKLTSIREELQEINPDDKWEENLKLILQKQETLNDAYNKKCKTLKDIEKEFDKVKNKRCQVFNEFFNSVKNNIDNIFKALYRNEAALAYIDVKNPDEPYLDGINFNCIIPKKRFVPMENLSGGEKTMSAMALLLAIYSVKPAPFLIFDEIDAALDYANIKNIVKYFLQIKSSTQIIIISHHYALSACADAIIGINICIRTNSSYAVHVKLDRYQKKILKEKCIKNTLTEKVSFFQAVKERGLNTP